MVKATPKGKEGEDKTVAQQKREKYVSCSTLVALVAFGVHRRPPLRFSLTPNSPNLYFQLNEIIRLFIISRPPPTTKDMGARSVGLT